MDNTPTAFQNAIKNIEANPRIGSSSTLRYSVLYLPTIVPALIFFLPYYFVDALQLSLLQTGFLLSFYGLGIFIAIHLTPYLNIRYSTRKIILSALCANCIALASFLYAKTFLWLSVNLVLLGFAGYLFKNAHSYLILQQYEESPILQAKILQQSYQASTIGLVLAMSAMALFALSNFTLLFIGVLISNAVPLFFLPKNTANHPKPTITENDTNPTVFAALLLFLGVLILSQLTTTLTIYLSLKFPQAGLRMIAIFLMVNIALVAGLQIPLLRVFNRGSPLLRGSFGALLIGLSFYIMNLAHLFTLVLLSAMIFSLGEILLIGNLHPLCRKHFQSILAMSLISGASLGAYVYQFFGATVLWQSCAGIGVVCFVLAMVRTSLIPSRKL